METLEAQGKDIPPIPEPLPVATFSAAPVTSVITTSPLENAVRDLVLDDLSPRHALEELDRLKGMVGT